MELMQLQAIKSLITS